MAKFPHFKQLDQMDCGPTCLKIITQYYGKEYPIQYLKELCNLTLEGTSLYGIKTASEKLGFKTLAVRISINKIEEIPLPCIAYWQNNHFVVIYRITSDYIYVSDPAQDLKKYSRYEFIKNWCSISNEANPDSGILLIVEITRTFINSYQEQNSRKSGFRYISAYLKNYRRVFFQLIAGLITVSIINLFFPLITQSIVDVGITNKDTKFITLILFSQIVLYISQAAIEFIRSWFLMYIGTGLNIMMVSDFLIKLMKLPVGFFDSKKLGDIFQRLVDHNRLQSFLTSSSLSILFSIISLVTYSIILLIYNKSIFFVFSAGSIIGISWMFIFLNKRKALDNRRFKLLAEEQNSVMQIIGGIQEIKINGSEEFRRNDWDIIQKKIFDTNIKSLSINQYQQTGSMLIYYMKNLIVTYLAANAVIENSLTLGMMLAISYIIGQLNAPIEHIIMFLQKAQDAKISFDRINEIHQLKHEQQDEDIANEQLQIEDNLLIENLSFYYEDHSSFVLKNISTVIQKGKKIAIVGSSGSGKSTLIKLLLKFYAPVSGKIIIGNRDLDNIPHKKWRQLCGAVLQDGYIFNDSIVRNIILSDVIDQGRLDEALEIANLHDFVHSLPQGYNTMIGTNGYGISQGQKQRILIARAVYKNAKYIFLDEATNSLDSGNEKIINMRLEKFYSGRTVIIIAHRLNTIVNSDSILVMDEGSIKEQGTHNYLLSLKGLYSKLINNQISQ